MWWEPTFSLSVSPPFLCPPVDLAWYLPGWLECWDNDDWPRGTTVIKHWDWSCAIRIVFYFNEYISQYCAFFKNHKKIEFAFLCHLEITLLICLEPLLLLLHFSILFLVRNYFNTRIAEYTFKFKILYNLRSSNETLDIIT